MLGLAIRGGTLIAADVGAAQDGSTLRASAAR